MACVSRRYAAPRRLRRREAGQLRRDGAGLRHPVRRGSLVPHRQGRRPDEERAHGKTPSPTPGKSGMGLHGRFPVVGSVHGGDQGS